MHGSGAGPTIRPLPYGLTPQQQQQQQQLILQQQFAMQQQQQLLMQQQVCDLTSNIDYCLIMLINVHKRPSLFKQAGCAGLRMVGHVCKQRL